MTSMVEGSVKVKNPDWSLSDPAWPVPEVSLNWFIQVVVTAKRRSSRQSVPSPCMQVPRGARARAVLLVPICGVALKAFWSRRSRPGVGVGLDHAVQRVGHRDGELKVGELGVVDVDRAVDVEDLDHQLVVGTASKKSK